MILQNNFSDWVKSWFWSNHNFCMKCSSNDKCSIHHIFGRSSDSILNGVVLCDKCHRIADGVNTGGYIGEEFRRDLMFVSWFFLFSIPDFLNLLPKDELKKMKEFILTHKKDSKIVLDKVEKLTDLPKPVL